MANYNLTVNSTFQPFSFDDYLKPYTIYDKAYREVEDTYADLATKANALKRLANDARDKDSKAYKQYTKYSEELENLANKLNKEGLNPSSRQQALSMRSRYASDISPIEEAYIKRDKLAEEQRKALLSDDSLLFDTDYSIARIDDMIANPSSTYKPISGNSLYKKGMAAGKAASARIMETNPALGKQYFEIRQGYGDEAANKWLLNQSSIPELKAAFDNIYKEYGVTDKNKEAATSYITSGIMDGLSEEVKYQANRDFTSNVERQRLQLEKERMDMLKDEREEAKLGIKMADGSYYKDIGAGRGRILNPKTNEVKIVSSEDFSNSGTFVEKQIVNNLTVGDKPIILANTGGEWHATDEVGSDAPSVKFGWTRSNLVSSWGNYSLDNLKNKEVVSSINEIPKEAQRRLLEFTTNNRLKLSNYDIVKVKASSKRAVGDYDYVLIPKQSNNTQVLQTTPSNTEETNNSTVKNDSITTTKPFNPNIGLQIK